MKPIVIVRMAKPGTIWWSNGKGRNRRDSIIALQRTYSRIHRTYIWSLAIGRFKIGVMFSAPLETK